ncbi:MAG: hypothetical protein HZC23_14450 [Rhodocyclales bacterium]|nr:hypothetical protein [Rhodocyclales bacterium]
MFYLDLFAELEREGVRYLLVGGLALNIHGVERATMDVDLMLALDSRNLNGFFNAARTLGLVPVLPVALSDFADPEKLRQWIEDKHMLAFALRPPRSSDPTLDILVQPKVDFESAWSRRIEKDLGATRVRLAAIDDLIALKTGTGRKRDEADIVALRRLRELGLG